MTSEEIDAMPAGREMDELIHHHVFGYVQRNWEGATHADGSPAQLYWEHPEPGYGGLGGPGSQPPFYSTDIAAAWATVKATHLFEDRYLTETTNGWCVYRFNERRDDPVTLDAPTAPLAVCRAALEVVMNHG